MAVSHALFVSTGIISPWPGWRNGRRSGLKIRCSQERAGSSPALGTKFPFLVLFHWQTRGKPASGTKAVQGSPTNFTHPPKKTCLSSRHFVVEFLHEQSRNA